MINFINGQTKVYGVIGDPISHTLSPQIHSYFADLSNKNMAYLPFYVKGMALGDAIRGAHALGIHGINVTVPHKKAVMPFLSDMDPMAERVGSVNTLVRKNDGYIGYNTDYIGIEQTLAALGLSFEGKRVAVIGAGGSAYAACVAAAENNASYLGIINRTISNSEILASHVKKYYNILVELQVEDSDKEYDMILQTTTLGFGELKDRSPATSTAIFSNVQLVFDFIYSPWETLFLQQAKAAGVSNIVNGFPMLVHQAAAAFSLWHDEKLEMGDHVETIAELCRQKSRWVDAN